MNIKNVRRNNPIDRRPVEDPKRVQREEPARAAAMRYEFSGTSDAARAQADEIPQITSKHLASDPYSRVVWHQDGKDAAIDEYIRRYYPVQVQAAEVAETVRRLLLEGMQGALSTGAATTAATKAKANDPASLELLARALIVPIAETFRSETSKKMEKHLRRFV